MARGARGARGARTEKGRGGARNARTTAGSNLPWYIAGVALVALILVLLVPIFTGDDGVPPRGAAPFGAAPGPGLDPLSGTPREQADRLFNRVMAAREQGNTAEAQQFAPMGIQAYQAVEPLDDDGIYHLAMLQIVTGDYAGAMATADRILGRNPNHLLALAAAGEAADLAGDGATALVYYRRFIQAYPTEIGRTLPEYQDHARIMPDLLETARQRAEQLS
jgi:tetratricopeptide (TPR) repeat protein